MHGPGRLFSAMHALVGRVVGTADHPTRNAAVTSVFLAQMREQQHVADVRRIRQDHDQAVDADAEPAGGREAVLQCPHVVVVDGHRLGVTRLALAGLVLEAGPLVDRVGESVWQTLRSGDVVRVDGGAVHLGDTAVATGVEMTESRVRDQLDEASSGLSSQLDSIVTNAARPKNEKAMTRSATSSRASGSRPANCQATAAADETSITESSTKPIRAVDDARVPASKATMASMTL